MSVEVKLTIAFILAGVAFLIMEYLHRKKIKRADERFKIVMKSLEEKAKRENKENK